MMGGVGKALRFGYFLCFIRFEREADFEVNNIGFKMDYKGTSCSPGGLFKQ